jgi:predicted thioesterase
VGTEVNIRHLAATPVGLTVTASAKVLEVDGRIVKFAVEAHDGVERIGDGTHTRAIIDMDRFEARTNAKLNGPGGR